MTNLNIENQTDSKKPLSVYTLIGWINFLRHKGNISQLETRRILSFILYKSTNMNTKELSLLTISQFEELINNDLKIYDSNNKQIEFIIVNFFILIPIIKDLPYLQQILNKNKEELLLSTIGSNKSLSPSNIQKDINYIAMRILFRI